MKIACAVVFFVVEVKSRMYSFRFGRLQPAFSFNVEQAFQLEMSTKHALFHNKKWVTTFFSFLSSLLSPISTFFFSRCLLLHTQKHRSLFYTCNKSINFAPFRRH